VIVVNLSMPHSAGGVIPAWFPYLHRIAFKARPTAGAITIARYTRYLIPPTIC